MSDAKRSVFGGFIFIFSYSRRNYEGVIQIMKSIDNFKITLIPSFSKTNMSDAIKNIMLINFKIPFSFIYNIRSNIKANIINNHRIYIRNEKLKE